MHRLDKLLQQKAEICLIAKKYKAEKVFVFGSCARKEETPDSDIDFLVEFSTEASLFDLVGLQLDLQDFLQCRVDVISKDGLHPNIKNNVIKDAIAL